MLPLLWYPFFRMEMEIAFAAMVSLDNLDCSITEIELPLALHPDFLITMAAGAWRIVAFHPAHTHFVFYHYVYVLCIRLKMFVGVRNPPPQ